MILQQDDKDAIVAIVAARHFSGAEMEMDQSEKRSTKGSGKLLRK